MLTPRAKEEGLPVNSQGNEMQGGGCNSILSCKARDSMYLAYNDGLKDPLKMEAQLLCFVLFLTGFTLQFVKQYLHTSMLPPDSF
jgi:hypothetical protein